MRNTGSSMALMNLLNDLRISTHELSNQLLVASLTLEIYPKPQDMPLEEYRLIEQQMNLMRNSIDRSRATISRLLCLVKAEEEGNPAAL